MAQVVDSSPELSRSVVSAHKVEPEKSWQTVVWDDPVNLMSYVAFVLQTHFGYPQDKAEHLMLRVHEQGSAVVAEGSREAMELHVEAMHGYGLWATLRQVGSE